MHHLKFIFLLFLFKSGLILLNASNKDSLSIRGMIRECDHKSEKVIEGYFLYVKIYDEKGLIAYTLANKDGTFFIQLPSDYLKRNSVNILASQIAPHDSLPQNNISEFSDSEAHWLPDSTNNEVSLHFCLARVMRCGPGPMLYFNPQSFQFHTNEAYPSDSFFKQVSTLCNKYPGLMIKLIPYCCSNDKATHYIRNKRMRKAKQMLVNLGVKSKQVIWIKNSNNPAPIENSKHCVSYISIVAVET